MQRHRRLDFRNVQATADTASKGISRDHRIKGDGGGVGVEGVVTGISAGFVERWKGDGVGDEIEIRAYVKVAAIEGVVDGCPDPKKVGTCVSSCKLGDGESNVAGAILGAMTTELALDKSGRDDEAK